MVPIVVPKLVRADVLDKGFGPPIYLLVGFLTILWETASNTNWIVQFLLSL